MHLWLHLAGLHVKGHGRAEEESHGGWLVAMAVAEGDSWDEAAASGGAQT